MPSDSEAMDDQKNQPVAQQAYDVLAEPYAALVDIKPHNAYYERPATLSLDSAGPGVAWGGGVGLLSSI